MLFAALFANSKSANKPKHVPPEPDILDKLDPLLFNKVITFFMFGINSNAGNSKSLRSSLR